MTPELQACRRALFAAAIPALLALLALPLLAGFRVDLASFLPVYVLAGAPALFLPYVAWRKLEPMRPVLEATALGLVLTIPVLVSTYAAMRFAMPLADGTLIAMDEAIGFDWPAFVRFVDRSRAASILLALGYSSFSLQLLFLPALLCAARLPARAYQLMLAYLILCALSAAIGGFFPSVGAYVAHNLDPAGLSHISAKFGHFFLASFHAVREQPDFVLGLGNAAGIVTFPSVHAGVAALCAWAAWPSRLLRYPFLALNLIMAAAAITHGAHYLVDIIAGGLVAGATVPLVKGLANAMRRRTSDAPRPAVAAARAV